MSFSSQNPNRRPDGDSPPEIVLPGAPNPNAATPVLYSFFPQSPNDMDPTSTALDTANPTPSCPPTFAPSRKVHPRSFHQFLPPSHAVNESLLLNDPTIHSRPLLSQEASSAYLPADSPPVVRRPHIDVDSEITRYGLEGLARQVEEFKRTDAARISHPGLQIFNPPAQIAQLTPKSDTDAWNNTKPVSSKVDKAASSKTRSRKPRASDLFLAADALGGNTLVDFVRTAYVYYLLMDETDGRREPSDQSEVDQN